MQAWKDNLPESIEEMAVVGPSSLWTTRVVVLGGVVVTGVVAGALGVVLYGAFSSLLAPSEPVDWARQPLEVVAEGDQAACMLNVDAVAPGRHAISVVAVDAPSVVRIEDPSGSAVFTAAREPAPESPRPHVAGPREPVPSLVPSLGRSDGPSVRLAVGTYRVVCDIADGLTASVPLRVRPASELE